MKYNQYSYIPVDSQTALLQLQELGFELEENYSPPKNLERFLRRFYFNYTDSDFPISQLIADWELDLLSFLQSDQDLTAEIFYQVALQLLGFVAHFDYTSVADFLDQLAFPIVFDNLIINLHQLLATRTKSGNTLIDQLLAQGLLAEDNSYHYFNGKSLATFKQADNLREVVYVDTGLDSDDDGQTDLIKVSIIRPNYAGQVPAIMTQSPYHQGVNEKASDQALHDMVGQLTIKKSGTIKVKPSKLPKQNMQTSNLPVAEAQEQLGYADYYSLNSYLLARGFANIYVSGLGTLDSDGFMTSGDYQQIQAYKAVIDWLNGRAIAYTSPKRQAQVRADWATGKVATTGISYLGTMSNGLATTGVDGLELIIAEAGISSWYNYYRENGLIVSPGGYPGEDLDSLAAFTYSRDLRAADYLHQHSKYVKKLAQMTQDLDRQSGDYNQFWQDRNYLPQADQVKCQVIFTHGSQDWNVKPIHVYQMFEALPQTVKKTLFFHNGAHVYMNNWQSIDFRETINALVSHKMLGQEEQINLPAIIWQENQAEQTWRELTDFAGQEVKPIALGQGLANIDNHYDQDTFERYCQNYQNFKDDLYADKAKQVSIDLSITEDLRLQGVSQLQLKVKSSTNKGLLSAQLLDFGPKKRLQPTPSIQAPRSMDNGRYFQQEAAMELPFKESPYRVLATAHLNLQNRTDLLSIETVEADQWMSITLDLQPTIYQLQKGDKLRLLLYTTDFEHTIRDNDDWQISLDLSQSSLLLRHS